MLVGPRRVLPPVTAYAGLVFSETGVRLLGGSLATPGLAPSGNLGNHSREVPIPGGSGTRLCLATWLADERIVVFGPWCPTRSRRNWRGVGAGGGRAGTSRRFPVSPLPYGRGSVSCDRCARLQPDFHWEG